MSAFEINKIVGAILAVALVVVVIGMVGDALVGGGGHEEAAEKGAPAVTAAVAPEAPAAPKAPAAPDKAAPIGELLKAASADDGRKIFKKCAACHTADEGGKDKLGPNLWNIVNAPVAHRDGFRYSQAMAAKAAAKGRWTYETLDAFLAGPRDYLPGTKMGFAGLKRASDRADVILYLRSLSEFPLPLP